MTSHIHTDFNKWIVVGRFIEAHKAERERGRSGSAALSPLTFDINVFVGGLRPGSKQLIHPLNPPLVFVQTGMQFSHPFLTPPLAALPSRFPCFYFLSLSLSLSFSLFLSLSLSFYLTLTLSSTFCHLCYLGET